MPTFERFGQVSIASLPPSDDGSDPIDYTHAKPVALPMAGAAVTEQALLDMADSFRLGAPALGKPGFSPGSRGDGNEITPQFLGRNHARFQPPDGDSVRPATFGMNNRPFTTARADGAQKSTNTSYPWRAAGRLYATVGRGTLTCSASLIKRGIVVTAAHCVASFGRNSVHTNIRYVPAYRNGRAPYGTWTVAHIAVLTSYLNGADQCAQRGVVCKNDVAILTLNPQSGRYPGASTGWFGYGWNGTGYNGMGVTHITQLGYPSCLDNGEFMERNDAQGSISASQSGNTVIGSLMCEGSSGGPWLVNFGFPSVLTGASTGAATQPNLVVGTTSWISSDEEKDMGASPFTSSNIVPLVSAACAATPSACAP